MGLSKEEFYDLTPIEFDFALKEYNEKEHSRQRFELTKMRLQTFMLIQYLSMSEVRFSTVQELLPFEWDKELEQPDINLNENDWITLEKKYIMRWQPN